MVGGDHFSHSPDFNELDLSGKPNNGGQQYTIVAAAAGTIVAMDDSNAEPTSSNNYVWIAHANGEWTKYTHLETGSATALGLAVGDAVNAGTVLGFEGDVGQASGEHVHFEVAIPDDVLNPIDGGGFIRGQAYVPLICGVPGNVLYDGQLYIAGPC
jgi:murein DD-endopeptidase MepM/ murein hydrolase activator NlpD